MSVPAIALSPLRAGRVCPADYTYSPSVFARAPDFTAGTLYVAGGLYGNLAALAEVERMAAAERGPVRISPAHASYFDRIVNGPACSVEQAAPKDWP
jgi:hypothetical protein